MDPGFRRGDSEEETEKRIRKENKNPSFHQSKMYRE